MSTPFFTEDFDDVASIAELIGVGRWTGYDEQASGTLEISTEQAVSGTKSLKCVVPANTGATPKAQIAMTGLSFPASSRLWAEWYIYLTGECNVLTLFDVEDSTLPSSPGRTFYLTTSERFRSIINKDGSPTDQFDQLIEQTPVPLGEWVQIRTSLRFSTSSTVGQASVWINGVLSLEGTGRTLPAASTGADRIQIGITATSNPSNGNTLYLDGIQFWTDRPAWDPIKTKGAYRRAYVRKPIGRRI